MSTSPDSHHVGTDARGELDKITKAASSRHKTGSRASSGMTNSASRSRQDEIATRYGSGVPSNLQYLSPDEVSGNKFDMMIEDFGTSGSDCSEESNDDAGMAFTGRTESIFGIAEPLTDRSHRQVPQFDNQSQQSEDDYMALRQLALLENEDDDIEVNSDEERDIMAEIRAEVTQKVREEMKSELDMYKKAKERLEKEDADDKEDDLTGMEPKIKEAMLKMRKLDKILLKKMKREKEVKRDRIRLQKRLKEELDNLKSDSEKKITFDEQRNTERFMLLALPPSHNAGISLENPDVDSPPHTPVTPVFQTQIPDDGTSRTAQGEGDGRSTGSSVRSHTEGRSTVSGISQSGASSASGMTTDSSGHKVKRNKKDFIKRNIQLASDAANAIAMTDDEKKRVEDLLSDIDMLSDVPEEDMSSTTTPNPFEIAVPAGDGFQPSAEERRQLQNIDTQLKFLMPPSEYESLTSMTPTSVSERGSMLFTRTNMSVLSGDFDQDLGEYSLQETKEQREKKKRLRNIEDELKKLTDAVELEMECPSLSDDQLNTLLDECALTMSQATIETNSLAHSSSRTTADSSRSSLYENAPQLAPEVLQKLLADAHSSVGDSSIVRNRDSRQDDELVLQSFSEDSVRDSRSTFRSDSRPTSQSGGSSHHIYRMKESNIQPRSSSTNRTVNGCLAEEARHHFLPEIDPKGRLSTQRPSSQRLNNEGFSSSRPNSQTLSNVYTVRNSFVDQSHEDREASSDDYDSDGSTPTVTPYPPSSGGRKSTSGGRR